MKSGTLGLVFLLVAFTSTYADEEQAQPVELSQSSLGLGIGIPYGFLAGFNFSHRVTDKVDFSLGLGLGDINDPRWSLGASFYPMRHSKLRISALYGTNGEVERDYCRRSSYGNYGSICNTEKDRYRGLNLGIGLGPGAGGSGWSLDAIFAITSNEPVETDTNDDGDVYSSSEIQSGYTRGTDERLQLGLGYQWAF